MLNVAIIYKEFSLKIDNAIIHGSMSDDSFLQIELC